MITNNLKAFLREIGLFCGSGYTKGLLPIRDVLGNTYYFAPHNGSGFPYYASFAYSTTMNTDGIKLGSGTNPPSASDYTLQAPISSGLSVSVMASMGIDNGIPFTEYMLTIHNTSSADITIGEIGYAQGMVSSSDQGSTNYTRRYFLWDRTVLSSPVTIAANDYATIRYKLTSTEV